MLTLLSDFIKFWNSLLSPSCLVFLDLHGRPQIREEMSEQILTQEILLKCGYGKIFVTLYTRVINNILAGECSCNSPQTSYPEQKCLPPQEAWQQLLGLSHSGGPLPFCLSHAWEIPQPFSGAETVESPSPHSETTTYLILSDMSSAAHAVLQCG